MPTEWFTVDKLVPLIVGRLPMRSLALKTYRSFLMHSDPIFSTRPLAPAPESPSAKIDCTLLRGEETSSNRQIICALRQKLPQNLPELATEVGLAEAAKVHELRLLAKAL